MNLEGDKPKFSFNPTPPSEPESILVKYRSIIKISDALMGVSLYPEMPKFIDVDWCQLKKPKHILTNSKIVWKYKIKFDFIPQNLILPREKDLIHQISLIQEILQKKITDFHLRIYETNIPGFRSKLRRMLVSILLKYGLEKNLVITYSGKFTP